MTHTEINETARSRIPGYSNLITVCLRCHAMLLWDCNSVPHLLAIGNDNIVQCLEIGCSLVPTEICMQVQ